MVKCATKRPVEILLVEDNPGDVRLTVECFKEGKIFNHISVVNDGEAAMAYLKNEGDYAGAIRPDLILLDLNLPKKDGRQVLKEIKDDPDLKTIPVIVLTTSKAEQDILSSYRLHANCYLEKPVKLDDFLRLIQMIEEFWLCVVRLPMNQSDC